MIMARADTWLDQNGQWTVHSPVSLLSGSRMVHLTTSSTPFALQKAGIPMVVIALDDYIRFVRKYGVNGELVHWFPPEFNNLGL